MSFFGFRLIWALEGSNIGRKTRGRLAKILPARQTNFWGFFGQPLGENTFSENASQNKSAIFIENMATHGQIFFVLSSIAFYLLLYTILYIYSHVCGGACA